MYLAEAHFVERDSQGQFVDGWPIGFGAQFEAPQHKTLGERLAVASRCLLDPAAGLPFFRLAHAVLCDSMDNALHKHFGVWPEDVLLLDPASRTLVLRGRREGADFRGGGWCAGGGFASQVEEYLQAAAAAAAVSAPGFST